MIEHSASRQTYVQDYAIDALPPARQPRAPWVSLLIFLAVFSLLQWSWTASRDTWVERLVVHDATVTPAAALVRLITPQIPAKAVAARIKAPGGGLNILNGCEGVEVMFLLVAAFAAVRMPWRQRTLAMASGLGLVFILNQARILTLFYAFRSDRALFDLLHTTVLPALLVAVAAGYFYATLHRSQGHLA